MKKNQSNWTDSLSKSVDLFREAVDQLATAGSQATSGAFSSTSKAISAATENLKREIRTARSSARVGFTFWKSLRRSKQ
jgi:hypothetical protein